MRKRKKDGWFEHGMNCAEYLELNFGSSPKPKPAPRGDAARQAADVMDGLLIDARTPKMSYEVSFRLHCCAARLLHASSRLTGWFRQ